MTAGDAKEKARARVSELVRHFKLNEAEYLKAGYNETQARTDFITPLLEAFGWDVKNRKGYPPALREVFEEATVEVGEERLSKKPDYELRLARQRKYFVEAKKPNVRIDRDKAAAFQARRYGFSASLPIAILTNFHQLAIYDCQPTPNLADEAHVARLKLVNYETFEAEFDSLWDMLSREQVYSGEFDRRFAVGGTRRGAEQFDDYFLRQVRSWRERLAIDIHANTPGLTPVELTYAVQLFLSRIVFLRICEDREIEKYETLKKLDNPGTFLALMGELKRADGFYDSGLFRLIDDAPLNIKISDEALQSIITELYYPLSPYTFAVVETEVLGEIYELFLGEVITVESGKVVIVSKPEVRESGGVVPTPRYVVDSIVARTLRPLTEGRTPDDLKGVTVADICCGSGIFLLSVFDFLQNHYLNWYLACDPSVRPHGAIYEVTGGQWRLTYEEKRRILLAHIRGVDIDANAVEVARFSLLLKLIEDESSSGLHEYIGRHHVPALPELDDALKSGNSLVSRKEWNETIGAIPAALVEQINPLTWADEFPKEIGSGGFDVIVGNPPYIRIQNMASYSPEETAFYQHRHSPYRTAAQDNFDKYALFIERSLSLLKPAGRLGFIVPHKFMTTHAGRALRELLSNGKLVAEIIHFGAQQVFGTGTSNYTCILVLDRKGEKQFNYEQVQNLEKWRYGTPGAVTVLPASDLSGNAWAFANSETRAIFDRIRASHPARLEDKAEIFVGLQTSRDEVYLLHPDTVAARTVTVTWDDKEWTIERDVLKPFLHDVQLSAFTQPTANALGIFPYRITGDRADLIQPAEFKKLYPGCWSYLNARKAELEKRNITGGRAADLQWYQYGRSQSLTKFDSPKIVLPALSVEPRYAIDHENIMVTGGGNGPYYLLRPLPGQSYSINVLLAVLNHPVSEAVVRTNTSLFRGGYYSHGKQFIKDLALPTLTQAKHDALDGLVRDLLGRIAALAAARAPHERTVLEREIADCRRNVETAVSEAFGLSDADMAVIRAVPVPF